MSERKNNLTKLTFNFETFFDSFQFSFVYIAQKHNSFFKTLYILM